MADEIERKFLLKSEAWRDDVFRRRLMRQGYLNSAGKSSVRVRVADDKAYLNIKSATLGIFRKEYEYKIPLTDAEEMLDQLCEGPLIEKIRYYVKFAEHVWEIDVFSGDNQGLVVAEVELAHENEAFDLPDWCGREVSGDVRYYNVSLVKCPYKTWLK